MEVRDLEIVTTTGMPKNAEVTVLFNNLCETSKTRYEKAYTDFMKWKSVNKFSSFTEDTFLVYFEELSKYKKPTTLWNTYSMLKSTLLPRHDIDISKYSKITHLIKQKNEGYRPLSRKENILSPQEIKTFINEAPDVKYLVTKVGLIFGTIGACSRQTIYNIKWKNVFDTRSTIFVVIEKPNTKATRSFTVSGKYYNVVKKYMDLRPKNCPCINFFLNYQNGRCTKQNIGINKIGYMGKQVARFLNLPNPDCFTGNCFRRSSARLLADAGREFLALKEATGQEHCINYSGGEGRLDDVNDNYNENSQDEWNNNSMEAESWEDESVCSEIEEKFNPAEYLQNMSQLNDEEEELKPLTDAHCCSESLHQTCTKESMVDEEQISTEKQCDEFKTANGEQNDLDSTTKENATTGFVIGRDNLHSERDDPHKHNGTESCGEDVGNNVLKITNKTLESVDIRRGGVFINQTGHSTPQCILSGLFPQVIFNNCTITNVYVHSKES